MSTPTAREILRAVSTNNPERRRDHITTIYGVVLLVAMSAAFLLHGVEVTLRSSVRSPMLSLGMLCLGLGSMLQLARALGPASLSPPIARWLAPAPLPRADLLRGSLAAAGILAASAGALFGLITALTAGFGLVPCVLEALGGFVLGLGLTALALWAQAHGRTRGATLRLAAITLMTVGAVVSVVAATHSTSLPQAAAWVPAVALLALALGLLLMGIIRRRSWLSRVSLASARDAGAATHAWLDAAASLDVGGVTAQNELNRARRIGSFSSRRPRGHQPYLELLTHQSIALQRRATRVLVGIVGCAAAWLTDRLFGADAAAVVLAVASASLALVVTPMLRAWLESSALWRMFPQDPRRAVGALSILPLGTVCLASGIAGWASGLGVGGLALGLASITLTLRRHRRPNIELGQVIDTPFGQIPLGIVVAVTFGTESLVAAVVVGLSFTWLIALAISAGWLVLTAGEVRPVGLRR